MANSSIKNLNIDGNVIISGSTTSIDVQQLTTDDPNITLNNVDSPTDSNANGGGITVKGSTDKIFNWINATDSWTSSEHLDLAVGKEYFIDGTSVLSATSLGSGITSIPGTLTSLQVDNIYIDGSQIGLAVTDTDLIALAEDRTSSYDEHIRFVSLEVNAGSVEKAEAKLKIQINDKVENTKINGNGPVDATFNAIKNLTNTEFKLKLYQVNAITAGTDAQGEVTVRLEDDNLSSQAKGSDPDIIVASAKAYINALNRLIFKKSKSIKVNLNDY